MVQYGVVWQVKGTTYVAVYHLTESVNILPASSYLRSTFLYFIYF